MMIQKELLLIIKTLTTFHPVLLGSQLNIWTDHANLMYTNITSQQVLCWHLYIKEYGPKIHWKAGKDNIEADMLSRYPRLERESKDEQLLYEELLLESFLNYPADVDIFPVNFDDGATAQTNNPDIQNWLNLPSFELHNYRSKQLVS